jgi:hypothetical protein
MAREPIFVIKKRRRITVDNSPLAWCEVWSGDSARDYMMRDYSPLKLVEKFRGVDEATRYIEGIGATVADVS